MLIRKFLLVLLTTVFVLVAALIFFQFEASAPAPITPLVENPAPTVVAKVPITVYFTDIHLYAAGIPPFEVGVTRWVPAEANLPRAVLEAFFKGPTSEESGMGLEAITSGFTGLRELRIETGIAHLYLEGACQSLGAIYTIAQPILRNLLQFEEIQYVKIYDAEGATEEPEGLVNSIPFCLEP